MFTHYSKEEIEIIKKEYPSGGTQAIRKLINRTPDSIRYQAKKIGVQRDEGFRLSKIDLNHLMSPTTAEAAYLLGIIWGDGNVTCGKKNRQYTTSLTIKKTDFTDISSLFTLFNKHNIKKQKKRWKQCVLAYLGHKIFATFLKSFDYLEKSVKSPCKVVNHIPRPLRCYFFRGWFDADGYNNSLPKGSYKIVMAGSHTQDWTALEKICEYLGIHYVINRIIRKNTNKYSVLRFQGYNQCLKLRSYLYPDGIDKLGLKRKSDNFFNIRIPIRPQSIAQTEQLNSK